MTYKGYANGQDDRRAALEALRKVTEEFGQMRDMLVDAGLAHQTIDINSRGVSALTIGEFLPILLAHLEYVTEFEAAEFSAYAAEHAAWKTGRRPAPTCALHDDDWRSDCGRCFEARLIRAERAEQKNG